MHKFQPPRLNLTHSPIITHPFPPIHTSPHSSSSLEISKTQYIATKKNHMKPIQSWVSEHKLATIGGLWASGIGASLVAYSRTSSPMKPSLRLIHARMHAQALTLAVLSGAAAYHYYENRAGEPKPQVESVAPSVAQPFEWELLSPF